MAKANVEITVPSYRKIIELGINFPYKIMFMKKAVARLAA